MIEPRSSYKRSGDKPVSSMKSYELDFIPRKVKKSKKIGLRPFVFNTPNKAIIEYQIGQMFRGWHKNVEKDDKNV